MELFEESTFELIEASPMRGLKEVTDITYKHLDGYLETELKHEILWNACLLIDDIIGTYNLVSITAPELPEPSENLDFTCNMLFSYLRQVSQEVEIQVTHLNIADIRQKYAQRLKSSFAYEFSQGDYDRIQQLINELREHVVQSKVIEEEHKHRLLKRLERLQSELHKRVADLDRFWGLIGDAGVVLGKFGEDVKPLVDNIKEIANITWNTQKKAEELPSEAPNPMIESQMTSE
ncbi:TPA: hypothetical protein ACVU1I_003552 [Vibrio cholerae]|uniref:hypothetical protein n=1 Tax=Vibrio cholerae TaxID=666 RepID=UPI00155E1F3E|nr:hypothetical protein [Vibrio cholerae]EGR0311413.1 hypothetical protein [Vibrio cholerae]NOF41097.1 hypothetical protein [Vibrio cholerae]